MKHLIPILVQAAYVPNTNPLSARRPCALECLDKLFPFALSWKPHAPQELPHL
jgi:hypothetical protein